MHIASIFCISIMKSPLKEIPFFLYKLDVVIKWILFTMQKSLLLHIIKNDDKQTCSSFYLHHKEKNLISLSFYSFDARGKQLEEAVHWQDDAVLRSKAYFYYDTMPPALKIKKVGKEDAGEYRWVLCPISTSHKSTRI